ncbi:MAG: response regulator [Deltaproteobacteria bacterium]|nr:response regulator [Deltaproteobacteria bacterium]
MKKILLIEDDKMVRENTAEILELARYSVTTAENGKRGILLLKEFVPDLIICDIMMPELDGYGVLHILSRDPDTVGIPFIFLTARAEKSEIRKGMELGADDYLTKPFEEAELLNAIQVRLKKSELLRKAVSGDADGLNRFLDAARGLKELEKLSEKRPVALYKKKDMIFQEGDSPNSLFFVSKGKVKTFKAHDDGKEYVTGFHVNGDYLGYIPLLENSAYSDSAKALEDCEICKIPKTDFFALLYKNRDVAAQFIKMLSNHVVENEKQLLSLAYDTVRKRIAQSLLLLAKSFPESGEKPLKVKLTREDLAGMAGTATETLSRCLSEFKTDKLIETEGRDIILLDREALERMT